MRVPPQATGAGIPVSPLSSARGSRSALRLPTALDRGQKHLPCSFSFGEHHLPRQAPLGVCEVSPPGSGHCHLKKDFVVATVAISLPLRADVLTN